ncbi:hypothetical protein MAR_022258 [Mya arenaria]|uniref:Uncharacterized protein n=1 Tax=Mya arenaria TaxID=6604 RepID=A0ABY7DNE2_MYAAR|nr:hypothetical protein MAR_022258 [Mya arenaria]
MNVKLENLKLIYEIKDGSFKEINVNAFIPKEYVSCISALKLTKVSESGEDCVLQTSVIIGTEEGYIIFLVNGQLQRCVQLFQTPISYIEVSNELYVIGSDIVYTIVDQTFNTKVEALSAVHLVKGDFFQHGSDQFLLFKSYPEDGVKGLLFDASFNLMTPDNDTDNDGRDGHSNVQTAVRALNKRLQTEELIYQERVQECGRLEEFLSATLTRQLHLAEGGDAHISGTSYDLLPLITGETDITISTRTKSPGFIFDVKNVWQKTYLHKWCVGVVISYKTERKVRAWLDLVPARGSGVTMTTSNARCVLIEPPDQSCGDGHSSSEPGALENDATGVDEVHASNSPSKPCEETLLSVTSVPRFDGEKVELTLILNWQVLTNELLVLDSLSSRREGNSRVFTRPCGQVTLAVADVLKGNHALDVVKGTADTAESEMGDWDDVRYDRLAFMAIQTATDLEICASPGVLCRIETLLTDRCRLRYSHHLDCYMCDSPVLSGVQFRLGEQRPGAPARDAVFFAQGNDDVLLMVHYLYSKLPDEVIISTKEISRDSDSAKACREALKKEANFLSSGLKKLLGDRDSGHISDDENDQEDARKVGEKFKRQQKHYFEEKSKKIEVPSRVVQRLAQLQSQTDAAFIKYSDVLSSKLSCAVL